MSRYTNVVTRGDLTPLFANDAGMRVLFLYDPYCPVNWFARVSIGLTTVRPGEAADEPLARADAAMYEAKSRGRNRTFWDIFEPNGGTELAEANRWAGVVREALSEDRWEIHYQPVMQLRDGKVAHYEALIRMPVLGGELIPPKDFLPAAQRFGLMS